jgi:hypothetical protein
MMIPGSSVPRTVVTLLTESLVGIVRAIEKPFWGTNRRPQRDATPAVPGASPKPVEPKDDESRLVRIEALSLCVGLKRENVCT